MLPQNLSFYFTILIRMHHHGHLLTGSPSLFYSIHSRDCSYSFPASKPSSATLWTSWCCFRLCGDKDCANHFTMHLQILPKAWVFLFTVFFAQHASLIGKITSSKTPASKVFLRLLQLKLILLSLIAPLCPNYAPSSSWQHVIVYIKE